MFLDLTSFSADFRSSRVTPCVDRRVCRTSLACAFRCVSDSSSRTGGTWDLESVGIGNETNRDLKAVDRELIYKVRQQVVHKVV